MSHREHRVKLRPVRLGVRNRVWIEGESDGRVYDGGGLLRAFCRDRRGPVQKFKGRTKKLTAAGFFALKKLRKIKGRT